MEQVQDFLAESEALAEAVSALPEAEWNAKTQFKGWTVNDVFVHLTFWNRAADQSLFEPDAFNATLGTIIAEMGKGGLRPIENRAIAERGRALLRLWQDGYRDMARRWAEVDPKARLKWVGPEMSARSSITARQMETWAHGQEIFDLMGLERAEADRVRNIVFLGVNTFGFAFKLNGLAVPEQVPRLILTAPSGAVWNFGNDQSPDSIEGSAVEFAQVQTQTRNIKDTALKVSGPVAEKWMEIAQCFAGAPEPPPAPGTRFRAA
ncbi:TIGR03084 family metal-binding protein [Mesorhizobium sp. Z1-4]|uniref:TIGR03084 family metal-binding protein n=1 Tax=Mesorhizobium sp. Z1-4 TaxID=2448478 RepID=UPI000FD85172|nr:TIGR03084 family metal-binding protein [Mesorhizobium sp. Z1-4]